jgi:hypothetical protein
LNPDIESACTELTRVVGDKKIVLHLDEIGSFAVSTGFTREAPSTELGKIEFQNYQLISLTQAVFIALSHCRALRVIFSGTSHAEGHILRFDTNLKSASILPLSESDPAFVEKVVSYFLDLSHLDATFVDRIWKELAGCRRSVQWFLQYFDSQLADVPGKDLTAKHIEAAIDHSLQQFLKQASANLISSADVANEALLAFAFYESFDGKLVIDDGTVVGIDFPAAHIPDAWLKWGASGALRLTSNSGGQRVTISWPYHFMVVFLQSNAKIVSSSSTDVLRSFLMACVAQPDTMPGLAFQFAVAQELTDSRSPFSERVRKLFPKCDSKAILPPVKLFTLPADLPSASHMDNVFMVVDRHSATTRYVDVAFPVFFKKSQVKVLMEIKRVADESACRAACVQFFQKCCASGDGDSLFLFVSYHEMDWKNVRAGTNVSKIRDFLKDSRFQILHGPSSFSGCGFPFDKLRPPSSVEDVRAFREQMLGSSPLKRYFGK